MHSEDRSLGTHDGPFHADEVTAAALLLLSDRIDLQRIHRTRDLARLQECEYVCDVGGVYDPQLKRFDHHQATYAGPLSSAGMVLAYLIEEGAFDAEEGAHLREEMMDGVDAEDTGRMESIPGVMTFSSLIENFMPIDHAAPSEEVEEGFYKALEFTLGHVDRLIQRFRYIRSSREKVRQVMEQKEWYLLFEQSMPWIDSFFALGGEEHPARFVVMPSGGGHWKIRGIPPSSSKKMQVRQPLPEEWAGRSGPELVAISGIPGAIFCHKGRFILICDSKEAALQALKQIAAS